MLVKCKINGKSYENDVEPRLLLVHFIRDYLNLTGTHIGCDTGHCGACTVIMNDRSLKSCMVLAVQAMDADILTIEGLAEEGTMHPIQKAFSENHALQCGYCTPGMIMSTYYLLMKNDKPNELDITNAIEGNLCMCTGYVNIVKAIKSLAREKT